MRSALGVAAAAALLIAASGKASWPWAAPFLACWVVSPLVAWWVSLPPKEVDGPRISEAQARKLRLIARRTWRYFERFAGPESHGLPADNFQEVPQPEVAQRTSPTNIGLALLSTVAANDFGWIGTGEMVQRLEATFATLAKLERYRGHFFNWYDTESLLPLEPRYVSTVDSGNLAGHLVALRRACLNRLEEPPSLEWALAGIADALEILRETAAAVSERIRGRVVTARQLDEAVRETSALLSPAPASQEEWAERLEALSSRAEILVDIGLALVQEADGSGSRSRARVGEGRPRLRAEPCARLRGGEARRRRRGRLREGALLHRRRRGPHRAGDGLHVPLRSLARALLDRLPHGRRDAGPEPLRPARVGGAPGQLRRDRVRRMCPSSTGFISAAR